MSLRPVDERERCFFTLPLTISNLSAKSQIQIAGGEKDARCIFVHNKLDRNCAYVKNKSVCVFHRPITLTFKLNIVL